MNPVSLTPAEFAADPAAVFDRVFCGEALLVQMGERQIRLLPTPAPGDAPPAGRRKRGGYEAVYRISEDFDPTADEILDAFEGKLEPEAY